MQEKHLEFIQNIINRMSNNSFILKGWSLTLVTGIIGFSLVNSISHLISLALIPALIFWGLDAYYLWQERLFRKLYDRVRGSKNKYIEPFSLNTKSVKKYVNNWLITAFSPTIILFHGAIILSIFLFIVILKRGF